jgi:orotate phosphoribosyltransferase
VRIIRDLVKRKGISWLSCSDEEIKLALLISFRRYGLKFRSAELFRKHGWKSDPAPRIETFYKRANGRTVRHNTSFIWDLREAIMYDESLFLTSILLWRKLQTYPVEWIGGLESSAIPLLAGILVVNNLQGRFPLKSFFLRKERKQDGLRRILEGARVERNARIVVVDDVLNKGIVKSRVIKYCHDNRLRVEGILVAVDTLSAASRSLSRHYAVQAIFTKKEIFSHTCDFYAVDDPRSKSIVVP